MRLHVLAVLIFGLAVSAENTPPFITNLNDTISVTEGTVGVVFTVQAIDVDNDQIQFSGIWNPTWASRIFTFNSQNARISVHTRVAPIMFRMFTFTLTVSASDGTTTTTGTLNIRIQQRIHNQAPSFSNLPTTVQLSNSQAPGVPFFTAYGMGKYANSVLRYAIQNPDSSFPQLLFTINPSNGQVSLDFSISSLPPQTIDLMISVNDGMTTATKPLTINIEPIRNLPPAFSKDRYFITVREGRDGKEVTDLAESVYDPNSGDTMSFKIYPSSLSHYFRMYITTGRVAFNGDYFLGNRPGVATLKVVVTDSGGLTDDALLNIYIVSAHNAQPQFTNEPYYAFASRLMSPGTTFFNVTATGKPDANLTFSLRGDLFTIDIFSGRVSLKYGINLFNLSPRVLEIPVGVSDGTTSEETILKIFVF